MTVTKTARLRFTPGFGNDVPTVTLGDLFDFCSELNRLGRPWDQAVKLGGTQLAAQWDVDSEDVA